MDEEPIAPVEQPKPRIKDSVHFSDTESRDMLAQLSSWVFFEMTKPQAPAFKRVSKGPGDIEIERVFMMRKTPDGIQVQFTRSKVTKNANSDTLPKQTEVSLRVEVPQPDKKEENKEFIKYQITYDDKGQETLVERHYNPTGNNDLDAAKKLITFTRTSEPDSEATSILYNKSKDEIKRLAKTEDDITHFENSHNGTVSDIFPLGQNIFPLKRI